MRSWTSAWAPPETTKNCKELQQAGGWWEDTLTGRCSFPIAPVNTFTNLAYLIAGAWFIATAKVSAQILFGVLLGLLGIASGLYHGFKLSWSHKLDEAGMYAVFSSLVVYSLAPSFPWITWVMGIVAAFVLRFVAYGPYGDQYLDPLTGAFVGVLGMELLLHGAYWYDLAAFAALGTAYKIWHMDKERTFWWPHWGHGIWHILTAVGISLLFLGVKQCIYGVS